MSFLNRKNYLQRDMASSPANPGAQALMDRMSQKGMQQVAGLSDLGGNLYPVRANSGRYPLPSLAEQQQQMQPAPGTYPQMGPPMQGPMQAIQRPTPGNVSNGGQVGPSSQVQQQPMQQQQMQGPPQPEGVPMRVSPGMYRMPDGRLVRGKGGMRPQMRQPQRAIGGEPLRPPPRAMPAQGLLSAPPKLRG